MSTFDIMQIIFNFFAVLYIHRFMIAFFDHAERRTEKWIPLLYLIYPLCATAVYYIWNYPILNLVANLFALFIISLQYRAGLGQRIIAIGMTYFSMMIIESLCVVTTNYIGGSPFHEGAYQNINGLVVYNLLTFLTSLAIYHLKNMKKCIVIPKSIWLAIAGIPVVSIIAIVVIFQNDAINQSQAVTTLVVFLAINGCTFFLYDALISAYNAKLQAVLLAGEKEYYYNQCQYMQQSEQNMQCFRHDVQNQLDMIRELLKQGQAEQVKQCAAKIEQKMYHSAPFSKTNHIALDSILNLKLTQAKNKNIFVSCKSAVPEDLELDSSDLMVILGNLLDNAITASESVKDKPFISVKITYDKGMLFISVENAYSGTIKEKDGHLLSTKKNQEDHGFGIKNIKKTVEQYHGVIEFHYSEDVFRVDAALYCKPVRQ